ncbi:alpha/beta hydrolase [Acuticoccus sediminis]|uniref:alpha/beta hydrolase n=1 Tax=Acuticoccus sediminis TaxID=2184697 RepID=UPI00384F7255
MLRKLRSVLVLSTALAAVVPAAASADPIRNIVLVHGAWVDGSGWKAVYDRLVEDGFHVLAVQEGESSFSGDVAATRRVLDLMDGPTILVGHSYGGSIITEAGVHPNVAGLVYVAAHAPDVGEDEHALGKKTPSVLGETADAIKTTPDGFTYLDPALFPKLFAPDLPADVADYAAHSQVMTAAGNFSTEMTEAAWREKPVWGVVAGNDQIISPELERFYYERAKADWIEIPGASHAVYMSHPDEVAAVIEKAAETVGADAD